MAPPDRAELRELYKIAIDEYRYEVSLNWDRLKHSFLVTAGLTGVGVTLLDKAGDHKGWALNVTTAGVFIAAGLSAVAGAEALLKSREYYRSTVYKKALIEQLLGYDTAIEGQPSDLARLAVETTDGMRRRGTILAWTAADLKKDRIRPGSVVFYSALLLGLLVLIDGLCAIGAIARIWL